MILYVCAGTHHRRLKSEYSGYVSSVSDMIQLDPSFYSLPALQMVFVCCATDTCSVLFPLLPFFFASVAAEPDFLTYSRIYWDGFKENPVSALLPMLELR